MGLLDSVSSIAGSISPITNLIPGGGIFNSALSTGTKLLGFLTGKGGVPDHERPDLIRISDSTGLTQQQASDLCAMEESRSRDNYDTIVKKYANNPQGLLPLIAEWNAKHPDRAIVAAAPAPVVVPPVVVQSLVTSTPVPAVVTQQPSLASNLTGEDVKDAGKAIIKGAQGGLSDWALNTPEGKAAKAEGFKSWLTDNQLPVAGFGLFVLFLIYKAFFAKK
jgi:hypothetical protein